MSKRVLIIIANSWFQDYEYSEPRKILEENWYKIDVASTKKWQCIWMFSLEALSEYTLEEIDSNLYDLVVMVWWNWAWHNFFNNENYLNIAKNAKNLWAICIAPTLVSFSGIYNWKKVTWWDNEWKQKNIIEQNWGIFTWENVTVDWNLVTANWPEAAKEFGEKLVELLSN